MTTVKENVTPTIVPKNQNKELLTPHRLTVSVLISEYYKVREEPVFCNKRRHFMRELCILILKLIQSPDLSFEELNVLINAVQPSKCRDKFIDAFHTAIKGITIGIGNMQDVVDSIGQLTLLDTQLGPNKVGAIARNSVVGCYLRRVIINFDKISFSEISMFFDAFKRYCDDLLNDKLECMINYTNAEKSRQFENRDWSQRQAELFIATQSALLISNQNKAYPPQELHKYIKGILKSNPELSAAHFLNYLNYLRVKEYCSAVESLYHCFDKSTNNEKGTNEERTKVYRYAALNLAILHCQFGHMKQGLMALKESIKMAQEASDNLCLQHALTWLRCLTYNAHKLMAEHSVIKATDLNLAYVMSLRIQSFVKYCGLSTANPLLVFDSLTSSDIISSQYCHGDLIATSFGLKAGLWLFYGKAEMCSLWSQLLLYLNADNLHVNKAYYGTSYVYALCNMAGQMHLEGDYALSNAILSHAEKRFPNEPMSHALILCRNLFNFQRSLFNEDPTSAEEAAAKIAVVDQWESYLCMAELYLHTEDYAEAHEYVNRVLYECKGSTNSVRMDVQVRAMILLSDIQIAANFPNPVIPGILGLLHSTLAYSMDFNMHYLAAIAQLHIAHVLLLMKMPQQASKVLNRCIIKILSDGGCYDRARVLLLHVHCQIACSANEGEKSKRDALINEVLQDLAKVQRDFEKVEATFRVKDVLLLQAKLAEEVANLGLRNKCSFDYQLINTERQSVFGSKLFKLL